MISSVRGEVLDIGLDHAVVEVGGVGLAVHATPTTLAGLRRGERSRLATALVVREDSLTLFGFADDEERELFGLLQTVSGIGPRIALATLAVLSPDVLRRALADGDITTITRVPGIGRKGAERLVLELRDKVVAPAAAAATLPVAVEREQPAPRAGGGGPGRPRFHREARRAGRRHRAGGRRRRRREHPAPRGAEPPGPVPVTRP